eukprot:5728095-Lingulodinium_polyedra.AAC.1
MASTTCDGRPVILTRTPRRAKATGNRARAARARGCNVANRTTSWRRVDTDSPAARPTARR